MKKTEKQFEEIRNICNEIFSKKFHDYGSSWRVLRPSSITDQIFIKAQRIRSIEINPNQKISDSITDEYIGIINYSIIALIQIELKDNHPINISFETANSLWNKYFSNAKDLMTNKNHDYGEAWRQMRVSSFTDIILMRIQRIKQIEDNEGNTFISEGVEANYLDIINYAVFALINLILENK